MEEQPVLQRPNGFDENEKKASSSEPSRVLYMRNLSYETTPAEIAAALEQWKPVRLLHFAHKGMALVEVGSSDLCKEACATYSAEPLELHNREAKVDVSTQTVTIDHGAVFEIGEDGSVPNEAAVNAGTPSRVLLLNVMKSQHETTLAAVHSLCSYIGKVNRLVLLDKHGKTTVLVEFGTLEEAVRAQKALYRHCLWSDQTGLIFSSFASQKELNFPTGQNSSTAWDCSQPAPEDASDSKSPRRKQSAVVMVAGFTKSKENLMHAHNLLSFWGNVRVIKFLMKKDNVCLVEFATPVEAANAVKMCVGASAFGQPIMVSHSKFPAVEVSSKDAFSRKFSQDRLWRYGTGVNSPQYTGVVCHPNPKLHVAFLTGYSEADLRSLFSRAGRVSGIRFMPGNGTVAFVDMDSVDSACTAMCLLHNRPNPFVKDSKGMRISFVKRKKKN